MLCQNCGKNEATTHIKQIVNGDMAESHLCAECAKNLGYSDMLSGFGLDLSEFLGGFLGDSYDRSKLYDPAFTTGFREASR